MKLELDWKGIAKKATAAVAGGLVVAAVTFSAPVHASNAYDRWARQNVIDRCYSGGTIVDGLGGAGCMSLEVFDYLKTVVHPDLKNFDTKEANRYTVYTGRYQEIKGLINSGNEQSALAKAASDLAKAAADAAKSAAQGAKTSSDSALSKIQGAWDDLLKERDTEAARYQVYVNKMNAAADSARVAEAAANTAATKAAAAADAVEAERLVEAGRYKHYVDLLKAAEASALAAETASSGLATNEASRYSDLAARSASVFAEVNSIGGQLGTLESNMMSQFERLASDWSGGGGGTGGGGMSEADVAAAHAQREEIIAGLRTRAVNCYEDQPEGVPWWASMSPRDQLGVPCNLFERTAERLSEFFKRKEAEDVAREELKEKRLELEEERRHQEAQEQRERMQAAEEVAAQRQAERDAAESAEAKAREAREQARRDAEEAAKERRHQELKKAVEDAANERSAAETAADKARRDLQEEVAGLGEAMKSGFQDVGRGLGELGSKIDGLGEAIRGMGSGGSSGPGVGAAPGIRSVQPSNLDGWKSLSSCVVVVPSGQGLCGAGPEFNFFGVKVKPLSYCGDMSAIRATVSFIGWVIVFAAAWMAFRWMLAAYGVAAPSEKSG